MNFSGYRVVYIGDVDGATACGRFRKVLERDWVKELSIDIPRFPGMYDFLIFISPEVTSLTTLSRVVDFLTL